MNNSTIFLKELFFFAYHGIHEEERIIGNQFKVDVEVNFLHQNNFNNITDTINYVEIYQLIQSKMNHPTPLLETLAESIIEAIAAFDKRIVTVSIAITKLQAPINNFTGNLGVRIQKNIRQ